ncbi:MAG: tripartite tricarboxylate transporter substrate binding protein [Betaproteobacteria bacterium]
MRRLFRLLIGGLLAAASALAFSQGAAPYPSKPVRLVTGFPGGGPTDLMARVFGEKLQAIWKQPIIVEARPGASGALSMEQLKNAPPDGYFLLMAPTNTMAVNPHLFPKLAYDPLKDFTLIARAANIDNVLAVNPSVPAKNLQELAALARSKPGELTFGSPANGSQAHLAGEFLNQHFGIKMVHVPYKGVGPAMNDLIGGQISMMFVPVANSLPHIKSGKLVPIAIPTRERNASIPDVATFAQQGIPGFEAVTWFMLIAPAGLPGEVTAKIRTDMATVLRDPDLRERLRAFGAEAGVVGEDLPAFLRADLARWGQVVRAAGIKAD